MGKRKTGLSRVIGLVALTIALAIIGFEAIVGGVAIGRGLIEGHGPFGVAAAGGQSSLGTRATTVSLNFTSPAAPGTTAYSGVSGLGNFHSMTVFATLANATGGTLDVYIQMSPDNGSTWIDFCHFTQLASGAAAASKVFTLSKSAQQTTITTVGTGTSPALAAGSVVGGEWGDRLRIVAVAGSGTTTGTAETVSLILVPTA